ncbi:MAG: sulfotransferase family 2 domain-containing protein [Pseudomonadota bacterium]
MSSLRYQARQFVRRAVYRQPVPSKLNEAVNFTKQAIFIAVPKTGTTSIRDQMTEPGPSMIPLPHLTICQVRDSLYPFLLSKALDQNKTFPTDLERVPSDKEIRDEAAEIFRTFFKFASVRNPWARTVSLYKRREGVQSDEDMSFDEFCEQLRFSSDTCRFPTRLTNQLDWLTDENGELLVDYVLKLEDQENGVREINERTDGRLALESVRLNSNPNSTADSYREMYSPATQERVAEVFRRDIEFFGYEF